jgi:hypothetical protein
MLLAVSEQKTSISLSVNMQSHSHKGLRVTTPDLSTFMEIPLDTPPISASRTPAYTPIGSDFELQWLRDIGRNDPMLRASLYPHRALGKNDDVVEALSVNVGVESAKRPHMWSETASAFILGKIVIDKSEFNDVNRARREFTEMNHESYIISADHERLRRIVRRASRTITEQTYELDSIATSVRRMYTDIVTTDQGGADGSDGVNFPDDDLRGAMARLHQAVRSIQQDVDSALEFVVSVNNVRRGDH